MPRADVTQMHFAKLYPLLVNKAEKKGRRREEVDRVTTWLTGYTAEEDVYKRQLYCSWNRIVNFLCWHGLFCR